MGGTSGHALFGQAKILTSKKIATKDEEQKKNFTQKMFYAFSKSRGDQTVNQYL